MNTSTVVSLPVSADLSSSKEYLLVKLTSTGVAVAAAGDKVIGTLIRGNDMPANGQSAVGMACDVFLTGGNGFHFATVGNDTAIAMGDDLEIDSTDGRLVKQTTGRAVAIALDSCPATNDGAVIRVVFAVDPAGSVSIPAATSHTITDSTGGTVSTSALASMTGVDGTGSNAAPLTTTKNSISTLAAELALVKADVAAIRTALIA